MWKFPAQSCNRRTSSRLCRSTALRWFSAVIACAAGRRGRSGISMCRRCHRHRHRPRRGFCPGIRRRGCGLCLNFRWSVQTGPGVGGGRRLPCNVRQMAHFISLRKRSQQTFPFLPNWHGICTHSGSLIIGVGASFDIVADTGWLRDAASGRRVLDAGQGVCSLHRRAQHDARRFNVAASKKTSSNRSAS